MGHTDDVADDAHNQKLSEDRAQAVRDRLAELADLGSWPDSVTGKGETEPAIDDTTDEARAANRRVVITITPTGGTQNGATPSSAPSAAPSSGAPDNSLPEPKGPVGTGPDGVTLTGPSDKGQITITLDHATRTGGLLLGQLKITTGPGGTNGSLGAWLSDPGTLGSNPRGENGNNIDIFYAADGLTLLSGNERVFPADYLPPGDEAHWPMTDLKLTDTLKEGATTTVCAVWPDTGQDTLTLDHQGNMNDTDYAFRLTNIPTTDS